MTATVEAVAASKKWNSRFTLLILLLIYITNQWSRYSIVYLGGVAVSECDNSICKFKENVNSTRKQIAEEPLCESYHCNPANTKCFECQKCYSENGASHKNLKYGTCLTSAQYGILVSFAYTLPFSVANLFAGRIADLYNRKFVVVFAVVGWAISTFIQGFAQSYGTLLFSRIFMGTALAFSNPASYSMIGDLFPVEQRGSANAFYSLGVYIGGGLSSICLVLGAEIGWRETSYLIATIEFILAATLLFGVDEPRKGSVQPSEQSYEEIPTDEDSEQINATGPPSLSKVLSLIFSDYAIIVLFAAAALRFFGGFAIGTFLPLYFKRRFPDYNVVYGTLNAFVVSIGGALSAFGGGRLADLLSPYDNRVLALIPSAGFVLGFIPMFGILYFDSFYLSMASLCVEYLLAECWFGPAITILQNRVDAHARGMTISIYLFVSSILGSFAPWLLGNLDDGSSVSSLRLNLLVCVGISYIGSGFLFLVVAYLMK